MILTSGLEKMGWPSLFSQFPTRNAKIAAARRLMICITPEAMGTVLIS
jgi:hypothetical protein